MTKEILTEAQISEIERLKGSEFVKIARKEQRLKYKKRQQLYILRNLEKRGRALAEAGITLDDLEAQLAELEYINDAETV